MTLAVDTQTIYQKNLAQNNLSSGVSTYPVPRHTDRWVISSQPINQWPASILPHTQQRDCRPLLDIIIIQISQVSREYSRNEVLDLYAGKGSGAIENASRKVIGLNGQSNKSTRNVQLFKNTDGELFDCEIEWTPSFRMRRNV